MARLKIGVSARLHHPEPGSTNVFSKTLHYLEQSMAHWLMARDVLVFMVPSVDAEGPLHRSNIRLADYAEHLDGLVLQGGADLAPESYGEAPLKPEWAGDRPRDRYEIELLQEFMTAGKPVLGICRGLQLINVACGGSLYQDVNAQVPDSGAHRKPDAYEDNFHDVLLEPESGLSRLYGNVRTGRVNSIHHQAIKTLGRDLAVEAWSQPDRLIEAVRSTRPGYVFGVQWHPEFMAPGAAGTLDPMPILDEFLTAIRKP